MVTDTLIDELKRFIKEYYRFVSLPDIFPTALGGGFAEIGKGVMPDRELDQVSRLLSGFVKEKRRPDFAHTLNSLREERGLEAAELYKAAWVDKRVYSKLMASGGRPSKDTVLQFAFALKLGGADLAVLLQSAGFALSDSSMRDLVFRFCAERGIFDLHDVNALLLAAGQKLLCKEPAEDQ
ncbi:MAG: helix-turn-helix domain-containing protein [Spirochaetaceae bacterium]|jgi:hypothetical protein|nr:helix-turn-helix domain-containing protein [Spirochaetaceae bacterium]